MSGDYLILLIFIKWKQLYIFGDGGIFLSLFSHNMPFDKWENKTKQKLKDRFHLKISIPINTVFSMFKTAIKKNQ